MSELETMDCEMLLDLLKIKVRAARRLDEELTAIRQRQYDVEREQKQTSTEVSDVLRALENKAARDE